jgi:hypothetical protein
MSLIGSFTVGSVVGRSVAKERLYSLWNMQVCVTRKEALVSRENGDGNDCGSDFTHLSTEQSEEQNEDAPAVLFPSCSVS